VKIAENTVTNVIMIKFALTVLHPTLTTGEHVYKNVLIILILMLKIIANLVGLSTALIVVILIPINAYIVMKDSFYLVNPIPSVLKNVPLEQF